MGAGREGADIWCHLKHRYPSGKWMGWELFEKRIWISRYFWHDSFGKYWNRFIGCRLRGHRKVQDISDPGESIAMHCFNCERRLEE